VKIGEALARARSILNQRRDFPVREASILLARLLDRPESWIRAHSGDELEVSDVEKFQEWLRRRRDGEPAEYLVGSCRFWSRDFFVGPEVLIPRPESEFLIREALSLALQPGSRVLDVGTGSGCLAVTLAAERPDLEVMASDLSLPALVLARRNILRHGVSVRLVCGDLARWISGPVDLVLANLPYLPSSLLPDLPPEVRREPLMALDGGPDGLDLVRKLIRDLERLLAPSAHVLLELAEKQAEILRAAPGSFVIERTLRDYGHCERVVLLRYRGQGPGMNSV